MKLLVFAHTPPPVHGQSLMVQAMVEGLGRPLPSAGASGAPEPGSRGITLYHVNARLSAGLEDVGTVRGGKLGRLLRYCLRAVWLRFRHGIDNFYYVPAPAARAPLYRDWIVLALCRPFFRRLILHWHAVGLGEWLATEARPWERAITRRLLDGAALAIVLTNFNEADARRLEPRRVAIVPNGIADPCPDFAERLAARRRDRVVARRCLLGNRPLTAEQRQAAGGDPEVVRVLYLAHCTRTKGVFDAIEGVREANRELVRRGSDLRMVLTVAGGFLDDAERREVEACQQAAPGELIYAGFLDRERKYAALAGADLFCFPTYYPNEGQPVALLEAMAFGLPPVTTRWRGIPECLPPAYPGLVEPRRPTELAATLIALLGTDGAELRALYRERFSGERHLEVLASALRSVADSDPGAEARG